MSNADRYIPIVEFAKTLRAYRWRIKDVECGGTACENPTKYKTWGAASNAANRAARRMNSQSEQLLRES